MPRYEYRCSRCMTSATLPRSIDEMDDAAECLNCGAPLTRHFAPTNMIFVPEHFHNTWSDFHDVTEKELARDPNIEMAGRVASMPGRRKG